MPLDGCSCLECHIYRWSIYARSMRINSKTYILLHACIVVASCHQDRIIHQLADAYQEIKNNWQQEANYIRGEKEAAITITIIYWSCNAMQCKHPGPLAVVVLFPFCFFSLESKKIEKKNEGKRQKAFFFLGKMMTRETHRQHRRSISRLLLW